MNSKKVVLMFLIILSLVTLTQAQSRGTIVYALRSDLIDTDGTGAYPDMQYIDKLEDDGYEVIKFFSISDLSTASAEAMDTLTTLPNLIIIGRSCPSVGFGNTDVGPGENRAIWNTLEAPVLCLEIWALRNTRLNWLNTSTMTSWTSVEDTVYNAVIDDAAKDDPVFEGLDTSAPIPWAAGLIDIIGDATTDGGNGQVLARTETNELLFVRFDAYTEFYDGTTDFPSGPRSVIGNGRDNSSAPPFNYWAFTEQSGQVFLAEVARMADLGGANAVDERENIITPSAFKLLQNYPNPFNPTTTIEYDLPKTSSVLLTVYNPNGQVVKQLVNQKQEPGIYTVTWDASSMPSGVYFYRIQAGDFQQVNKCLLIK
jgi:hypothetical protein